MTDMSPHIAKSCPSVRRLRLIPQFGQRMHVQRVIRNTPHAVNRWLQLGQARSNMMSNDRVERPATLPVPRPDAAHDAPRSAPTRC